MDNTTSGSISIQAKLATQEQTPEQQLFNQLIEQIEQERNRLAAWQQMIPLYQQHYHQAYLPLLQQSNWQQEQLILLFNQAYDALNLSKREKKNLSQLIIQLADGISPDAQSPEIQQIISMHDADSPSVRTPPRPQASPEAGDPEVYTAESWEQAAECREQQKKQRQAARKAARAEKPARQQIPQEDTSRSIREVYRKLASALHPDRAQSDQDQVHMTSMMQRVNVAYGNKNLLQLLELQLEIEQIDQQTLQSLNNTRLRQYNQTFSEQLRQLKQEIEDIERSFGLPPPAGKTSPGALLRRLRGQISQKQKDIDHLQYQLKLFSEPAYLQSWLRSTIR
jgi:hypothetical protein